MNQSVGVAVLLCTVACWGVTAHAQSTKPIASKPKNPNAVAGHPEAALERKILIDPTDVPARLALAKEYLQAPERLRSQVDAAQEQLAEALRQDPGNAEAAKLSGFAAVREGQYTQAATFYRLAVQANPSDALAQLALGGALDALGDTAGADAAYAAYRQLEQMPPVPTEQQAAAEQPSEVPTDAVTTLPTAPGREQEP